MSGTYVIDSRDISVGSELEDDNVDDRHGYLVHVCFDLSKVGVVVYDVWCR